MTLQVDILGFCTIAIEALYITQMPVMLLLWLLSPGRQWNDRLSCYKEWQKNDFYLNRKVKLLIFNSLGCYSTVLSSGLKQRHFPIKCLNTVGTNNWHVNGWDSNSGCRALLDSAVIADMSESWPILLDQGWVWPDQLGLSHLSSILFLGHIVLPRHVLMAMAEFQAWGSPITQVLCQTLLLSHLLVFHQPKQVKWLNTESRGKRGYPLS